MGEMQQLLALWLLVGMATAWFSIFEVMAGFRIERLTVLNVVPILFVSAMLGARWPLTLVSRFGQWLAKLDDPRIEGADLANAAKAINEEALG